MSNRLILFSAFCFLHTFGFVGAAQPSKKLTRPIVLSPAKPTVHITFVKFGKREPRHSSESSEGVWLRVHNNTKWPLTFFGFGKFVNEREDEIVFYGVEEVIERGDLINRDPPPVVDPPPPGSPPEPEVATKPTTQVPDYKECVRAPDDWGIDVVSPITVPPGRSMIFSVPREALCRNLIIYIKYNYSWEQSEKYNEPEHRVYFAGSQLPE